MSHFTIPSGIMDINSRLAYERAIEFLKPKNMILSIEEIEHLHSLITMNDSHLSTLDPQDEKDKYRKDGKVYYYPKSRRSIDHRKIHEIVFQEDPEEVQEFNDDLQKYGEWKDLIYHEKISPFCMEVLFEKISDESNGSKNEFLNDWKSLHDICIVKNEKSEEKNIEVDTPSTTDSIIDTTKKYMSEKEERDVNSDQNKTQSKDNVECKDVEKYNENGEIRENNNSLKMNPIIYAMKLHDMIFSRRPFVRGNKRLARLLLCHIFLKHNVYPPAFLSYAGYINKAYIHFEEDEEEMIYTSEKTRDTTNTENNCMTRKNIRDLNFLTYLSNLSSKGKFEMSGVNDKTISERWEMIMSLQDNYGGKEDSTMLSIHTLLSSRQEVLIGELLMSMRYVCPVEGDFFIVKESQEGKYKVVNTPENIEKEWLFGRLNENIAHALVKLNENGLVNFTKSSEEVKFRIEIMIRVCI